MFKKIGSLPSSSNQLISVSAHYSMLLSKWIENLLKAVKTMSSAYFLS